MVSTPHRPKKAVPGRDAAAGAGAGSCEEPGDVHPVGECRNPTRRSLLMLYALSECREEEALTFEAHLLSCEACFRDLKCLDRAGALIREFTAAPAPGLDRLRLLLRGDASARD